MTDLSKTDLSMTASDLEYCLREWQKVLRLQDWDIKAELCSAARLHGKLGSCSVSFSKKAAKILILDRASHDATIDSDWPYDPELTLVHELLHCHSGFMDGMTDYVETFEEHMVESIATGLVGLRRFLPSALTQSITTTTRNCQICLSREAKSKFSPVLE